MMFSIKEAAQFINKKGNYKMEKFEQTQDQESWVAFRPVLLFGREEMVYINVTVVYPENNITFITPLHGKGSAGVVGDDAGILDGIMHYFNARSKGGYLTKYTYDDSGAIVFMLHFPLSRMDVKWFEFTLDYCTDAVMVFRPLIDGIIHSLHLRLDEKAGALDKARHYLENHAHQFMELLPSH